MKNPDLRTQAHARVTVTLEIESDSVWGPETALSQVYSQAAEGALGKLRRVLAEELRAGRIRIVGEPEVKQILTQEAR